MKNIALFVNRYRDADLSATKEVISLLQKYNKTVYLDVSLKDEIDASDLMFAQGDGIFECCDAVIALGGDGTILKIVNQSADFDVPIMGINLGHLGFLTQAERDDLSNLVKILEGDYTVERRMMLEAQVMSGDKKIASYTALNDIIIRGDSAKMIALIAEVDGTCASSYLADGIIVATSTGSTAYSLSCGGPIVHKALDCMILTPICPHTMKSRCMIIPPQSSAAIAFDGAYCDEADLRIDGISVKRLGADEYIKIVQSEKRVPMINVNSRGYFDVIREKLSD